MKLYTYVVAYDSGFSPNPFWGYCTLACCKPGIRRTANKDDWIIGLSRRSKGKGSRLVYAMKVTEDSISFAQYFNDPRFKKKKPNWDNKLTVFKCGDNIYEPGKRGYKQLPSTHSRGACENPKNKKRDLSGKKVLISDHFYYFGGAGPHLPSELRTLIPGRGHRCRFPPETVQKFLEFITDHKRGIHGRPTKWAVGDTSWRQK